MYDFPHKKTSNEIKFKKQLADLEARLHELLELTVAYAQLDFSKKAEVDKSGSPVSLLALSLNMLGEELQFSTYSKANIQAIIDSLSEMLFVLDTKGKILSVNRKTLELLQIADHEVCEKHISEILHNDRAGLQVKANIMSLIDQGALKEVEAAIVSSSGEKIPTLITGTPLTLPSGKLKGFVLSAKDTRDSKVLQNLKDTQSQLIQSGKLAALGEMSSGLAHELNNPLFLIRGFNNRIEIEMEKQGICNETLKDYINEVRESCNRMSDIINHFRDFSRQSPESYSPASLHDILRKAHKWLKAQLDLHSIQLEWDLSSKDPLINCDRNQLEQVFVNLLTNSKDSICQHHPDGGGHICIRTEGIGDYVSVSVKDNGLGVDEKLADKLFDPFFTTKEVGEGTGLGLSISFGIITNHHGEITLSSSSGEGATFTTRLPLAHIN